MTSSPARRTAAGLCRLVLAAAASIAAPVAVALAPTLAHADADDEASLLIEDARDALADRDLDRAASLLDRAIAADPRRIDAYVLRSSVHVARKEYADAVTVAQRARTLAPGNLDVLEALGGALVLAGRADDGVPLLERVVAAQPRRYQASAVLGTTYVDRGEWAKAITALTAYLDTRPRSLARSDVRYQLDLAHARLRDGDVAGARALYATIVEARPRSVLARLGLAWATAAADCREAMPLLRDLADVAEQHPEVLSVQSRCALLLGDLDEAIATADRYRARRPDAPEAHAVLGEAYAARGETAKALASLTRAVELDAGNAVYALKLARVERRSGKPADAAARLRAAGAPPGFEDDWTVELGHASYDAGQLEEARELLAAHVARRADDAVAQVVLGLAVLDLGQPDPAIPHLSRGVALGSTDPRARPALVRALGLRAVAAFEAGDLERAEQDLVDATGVADDAGTWRNLGAVRLARNNGRGALDALQRAGDDPVALYLLGRAHVAVGQLDEAIEAMRQAAKAPPDATFAADVAVDLAFALQRAGQLDDAVDVLARAVQANRDATVEARLVETYFTVVRASATDHLGEGRFAAAHRLLDAARARLPKGNDALRTALECDLALAATAIGRRDDALGLLRALDKRKATCPYVAPADALAIDILIAWNEGTGASKHAKSALATLDGLRARATGQAASLLGVAARDVAVRAAVDAYDRGKTRDARSFLEIARRYDRTSEEITHNLTILDIGTSSRAIASLEALARDVPEALINLGIAYEMNGQPVEALRAWERAQAARVRHPDLDAWIATKRRLWGSP